MVDRLKKYLTLLLISVILSGCVSTQIAKESWEYSRLIIIDPLDYNNLLKIVIDKSDVKILASEYDNKLRSMGVEGWELVAVMTGNRYLFKRKL